MILDNLSYLNIIYYYTYILSETKLLKNTDDISSNDECHIII